MIDEVRAWFEQDDNVIATYTDREGNTVILVLDDAPEVLAPYATRAAGVRIVKSDPIVAWTRLDKHRPAPGGVSVGHYKITAGTLGCWVQDRAGKKYILSNNHVLANVNAASPGDNILQPGAADGGSNPSDAIADLTRFVRIANGVSVDCAIAEVRNTDDIDLSILDIGPVYGVAEPYLGQQIWKSGRTTSVSRGRVDTIDASVKVGYGSNVTYTITDCIISGIPGGPGDSGSAVLDFASNEIVGLLFAGNSQITVICKATNVFEQLNIEPIPVSQIVRSMWLDISKWQGVNDFVKIKAAGVRGVIIKICQGADIIDPKFAENYAGAKAAGLLVSGYIYVDPAVSAAAHFANFRAVVGERKFDVPPAIDIEQTSGQTPQVITAVVQQLGAMLENWHGSKPLIYTNQAFPNANFLPWSGWKDYPLWMAYWSETALVPALPEAWKGAPGKPEMWQFWVSPNGAALGVGSEKVDLNVTHRSFEKFLEGGGTPPEMVNLTITIEGSGSVSPGSGQYAKGSTVQLQATPAAGWFFQGWGGDLSGTDNPASLLMDADKDIAAVFIEHEGGPAEFVHHKGRTLINAQNYRRGPGTGYQSLGQMPAGTILEIMEEVKDAAGNTWARIGYKEYAAILHNGIKYIEYVMVGE